MKNFFSISIAVIISFILIGLIFWIFCLNHVEVNEFGVAYNSYSGNVYVQKRPGWYQSNVFTKVAYISTVPIKVTIPSDAKVIVSKMVKFNINGVNEFIQLQGFSYSMNMNMENILLGYAFSGNKYSFFDVLQETTTETLGVDRKIIK